MSLLPQLDVLASYLPTLVKKFHADGVPLSDTPISGTLQAALLFADISGFTALTERLARSGPAGVEELTRILNTTFTNILDIIDQHGGDVIKFAGDALLAVWPVEEEDLPAAVVRASQCALGIQQRISSYYRLVSSAPLALRIGISAGEVATRHIGGVYGRWEFLVTGAAIGELSAAEHLAAPGEVVLSPGAWDLIRSWGTGTPLTGGGPPHSVRLDTVQTSIEPRPLPDVPVTPELETSLRAYVPGAVMNRLVAGQRAWLADLRRVTVIFINLPDLTYTAPVEQAHTAMRALQQVIYRYEGSVNKLSLDDKGVTLVAALGLPPLSHENDAVRGVQVALAAERILRELGLECAIGVATGRVFCGEIGSDQRREYTMIGDTVNLAARLMQVAGKVPHEDAPAGLLCDAATCQAVQAMYARAPVTFEELPSVSVKGKAEPIQIYRPAEDPAAQPVPGSAAPGYRVVSVGREAERTLLEAQVAALRNGAPGGVVMIEGEAGMGKSHLVAAARGMAEQQRITVFQGAADASEQATPYYAWRGIFSRLLDLDVLSGADARRMHILSLLEDEPDVLPLAPLLNPLLLLDLPDNEVTSQLSGQLRADATRDLLLRMLRDSAARSPKLLVLEDAHWMDAASWALALTVSRQVYPMLLILAMRPFATQVGARFGEGAAPAEFYHLRAAAHAVLQLDALSPEESVLLVCRRLGVRELPAPAAELIGEKAQGNPFFSEALAYALRDTGLIQIVGDECLLAPGADLHALSFPETVQGAIISRVDRLTPTQQLTLKVASVVGRVFPYRTLQAIYPMEISPDHLDDDLAALARLDITPLDTPEPEVTYAFKHAIIQDVVYNLMLFAQRRQLHRAVAEFYERTYGSLSPDEEVLQTAGEVRRLAQEAALAPYYTLLAHHWGKAEVAPRALAYLEQAGYHALRISAIQDALAMFAQALTLLNEHDQEVIPRHCRRRTIITRLIGEAHQQRGAFDMARAHYDESLALARSCGVCDDEIAVLSRKGRLLTDLGNYQEAHHCLQLALQLARTGQNRHLIVDVLINLGNLAYREGVHNEAEHHYQECLVLASEQNDRLAVAVVLNGLGNSAIAQGSFAEARYCYEESLATRRALGDRWGAAGTLSNLGWLHHIEGDYLHARACYEESLAIYRSIGDLRGQATALNNLGLTVIELHDRPAALRLFEEALQAALATGVTPIVLEVLLGFGQIHLAENNLIQAAELLGLALYHPAANTEIQMQADPLRAALLNRLGQDQLTTAMARGSELRLEDAIAFVRTA